MRTVLPLSIAMLAACVLAGCRPAAHLAPGIRSPLRPSKEIKETVGVGPACEIVDGFGYARFGPPILSGDSSSFIAISGSGARVWDCRTFRPASRLLQQDNVQFYGLTADGKKAFTADEHTVRIWDVARSELLDEARLSDRDLEWVSLSPDGTLLLTIAKGEKSVAVWQTGKAKPLLKLAHEREPATAIFDPTGSRIATDDGLIHIFAVDSGHEVCPPIGIDYECDFGQSRVSFDCTGKKLLVPKARGYAIIDARSGKALSEVRYSDRDESAFHVRWSADGLLVSMTTQRAVGYGPARIYDAATGKLEREIGSDIYDCWIGTGRQWAPLRPEGAKLELWDLARARKLHSLDAYGAYVSPDRLVVLTVVHENLGSALRLVRSAARDGG